MKIDIDSVKDIIAKTIAVPVDCIEDDTEIGDLPEWDSVSHLIIISEIESVFNVKFSSEEIRKMKSVNDIFNQIESLISKQNI